MKRSVLRRKTALTRSKTLRKKKPGNLNLELDQLVRQIVLARDGFRCVKCLKDATGREGRKVALQAAHIMPKGAYPALRHELDNVITLCWRDHMVFWHRNPIEAMEWLIGKYGQAYVDRLRYLAQTRAKVDKQALKIYLQALLPGKTG